MTLIATVLTVLLLALAGLHILWGVGFWWPIRDERRLVATVVGFTASERMPGPIPCALVATGLIFAAAWPWFPPGPIRQAGLAIAMTVFLIRAVLPWRPGWRRMTRQEPFATLDRRHYGPLCGIIGAGFAVLLIEGAIR